MSGDVLRLAVAAPWLPAEAAASRATGVGLLVLPRLAALAPEPSDGSLAHALGTIAAASRLPLLFAYAEACSGLRHLTLQLVLADGRATANYRATHLGAAAVDAGWSPGNWLTMARLEPSTVGFMAGADHLAPEVGRALSALGAAALIAVLDPQDDAHPDLLAPLVRLRAIENGVPVCIVGSAGHVYAATSAGAPIESRAEAGLVHLTLPLDMGARPVPRRPDLYRQLAVIPGG